MDNSNDNFGNGTHDLQACSAVPQSTAEPRETLMYKDFLKIRQENSSMIEIWQNNGHFTQKPIYIFDYISLSSPYNEKRFRQEL